MTTTDKQAAAKVAKWTWSKGRFKVTAHTDLKVTAEQLKNWIKTTDDPRAGQGANINTLVREVSVYKRSKYPILNIQ